MVPFLSTLNCIIIEIQEGTIILTTTLLHFCMNPSRVSGSRDEGSGLGSSCIRLEQDSGLAFRDTLDW